MNREIRVNKVSDYTLHIKYPAKMTEEDLKNEFTLQVRDWKVVKVNKAYQINEYSKILERIEEMDKALLRRKLNKKSIDEKQEKAHLKLLLKRDQVFKEITIPSQAKNSPTFSYCFLTMNTKASVSEILDYYQNYTS